MLRFARSLRSLRRRLSPPRRSSLEEPRARGPRCAASVAGRTAAGPRSAWAPCAFASGAPSPGRGMPGRRPRPVRAVPRANSHASAATAPMAASTFSTRGRPRPSVTKIACSRGRGVSLWLPGGDEGAEVVTAEIGVSEVNRSERGHKPRAERGLVRWPLRLQRLRPQEVRSHANGSGIRFEGRTRRRPDGYGMLRGVVARLSRFATAQPSGPSPLCRRNRPTCRPRRPGRRAPLKGRSAQWRWPSRPACRRRSIRWVARD